MAYATNSISCMSSKINSPLPIYHPGGIPYRLSKIGVCKYVSVCQCAIEQAGIIHRCVIPERLPRKVFKICLMGMDRQPAL